MINEERVKQMTKIAAYESGPGKENIRIGSYFRSDYISIGVLKAFIAATISFLAGFALYMVSTIEEFMEKMYDMDLMGYGQDILKKYVIFVVIYCVIAYIYYTYRYFAAIQSLKGYYGELKDLGILFGEPTEPEKRKKSQNSKKEKKAGGRK